MKVRLDLEYDGSEFHGWQTQPDARTVQETLEEALARLFSTPVRVAAAGRTDAGVHARGQVACFLAPRALAPESIRRALNTLTPADLSVKEACLVSDDFDPRRSARSRVYVYRIWNRPAASPFWRRYAWHVRGRLDDERMAAAAAMLVGEHDFSSFRAAGCDAARPIRRVASSRIWRTDDVVGYEIEATAFLRHMVRNIVGTLVEIGRGYRRQEMESLLAARDRGVAGATAPAHGLCLERVSY